MTSVSGGFITIKSRFWDKLTGLIRQGEGNMRSVAFACLLLAALMVLGCASMATQTKQYENVDAMLVQRNIDGIIAQIEAQKDKAYKEKDRVIYYLDLGMLYRYKGDYNTSNQFLTQAEEAMEELYTKSVSKAATSLLLNDNALDYFGEDYEDVYTNVFKAMNYLHLNQFESAFVEVRRINDKLSFLEDKYQKVAKEYGSAKENALAYEVGSNKFHNSALGRYLSMIAYKAEGKPHDAKIDYDKIQEAFKAQPEIYTFAIPDLYDPLGQMKEPTLNVVALVGKAPVKYERELHVKTLPNQILVVYVDKSVADRVYNWPGINPNYYFKFALPYIVNPESAVGSVEVVISDAAKPIPLKKIEDIGNVAVQTYKIKEPVIYTKSIIRSVVKGVAAELAKAEMQKKNPGLAGSLMSFATDVAVLASENADTRISRFFPNDVMCSEIPLAEGKYNVKVNYLDKNKTPIFSHDLGEVFVSKRGLNFVESWYIQ